MVGKTIIHACLAAALTFGVGAAAPARAADGGAIVAGVIGGVALGALVAGAVHAAPPSPAYYAPAYAPSYYPPPPPHCWREPRQVWDGYGYVTRPVRVCE